MVVVAGNMHIKRTIPLRAILDRNLAIADRVPNALRWHHRIPPTTGDVAEYFGVLSTSVLSK